MLFFENLSLRRGKKVLFEHAHFSLNPRDRVGVVGANGCGKSSLFALIRGELEEDGGNISLQDNVIIASVKQETPAVELSAIDYVLQGDIELCELKQKIEEQSDSDDGIAIGALHNQFEQIDGYSAEARAAELLHGLGFNKDNDRNAVSSFSGGWRMRLNLAQALMCRSDLLLLDEPTNHLDFETVLWLERWLNAYQGAVLLISHDREFMDKVINRVLHIENQQVNLYTGDYSTFEVQRSEKLALQQAQYDKQQKQITHMQSFITRFKAKATKAKQAQSRVKALERMEKIAPAHINSPFNFAFKELGFLQSPLLALNDADVGYGDTKILNQVQFSLRPQDRIGLIGQNGAGKSTLIKLLADELQLKTGERVESKVLNVGYFAQHQLEQLHLDMSPLQHLMLLDKSATESDLRSYLGGFDFNGDKALEPIAPFSGGEKARLVLAMIVYLQPNVLLLDEPTNHLDLEMRHALNMALQGFEGAVVLVSHDRHMVETVCDDLYLVAKGRVEQFVGDLDEYARWVNEQRLMLAQQRKANQKHGLLANASSVDLIEKKQSINAAKSISKKEQRQRDAEMRKQLQPLRKAVQSFELSLEKLQVRQAEIDRELAEPEMYDDANKSTLLKINQEYADVKANIEVIEMQWMQALEDLEAAEAQLIALSNE